MKLFKPNVSVEEAIKCPEEWIPEGIYCYRINCDGDSIFNATGYLCPFWEDDVSKPRQMNGYCHYLKSGDWYEPDNGGTMLLWDMCKECGVND